MGNKKQDQRIILFVGSPITKAQNEKLLIKAAKRLKKNNVSVDIVNFGESEENTDLLTRFVDAVKANDNSNLVTVEPGKLLSDVLISTAIFSQSGQQISEYGGVGGGDFGGIDPNTDPELAMALRMSMEEERQRQEAEAKKAAENNNEENGDKVDGDDDDKQKNEKVEDDNVGGDDEMGIDDEDEELLKALQMSMEENEDNDVDMDKKAEDNFVDELLDGLPGIDAGDLEEIGNMEDLLAAVDDDEDDKDKDKKEKTN